MTGNTGERTESLKTLDKTAIEDPVLVNTVTERLANLNRLTKESPKRSAEPDEDDDKSTPEDKDDQQADDQDTSKDTTPSDVDDDKDADTDVVLPPEYLRAAIHRGWKEEDAKKYFEDNPEAALNTFQNVYTDINNASREWALLGKVRLERDKISDVSVAKVEPEFKGVDVDKLKEEYDLDDKTVAILKAQNQQFEELSKQRQPEPVQQQVQQAPAGPNPNVELDIENFFKSADLNAYSDFYGKLELGQDWTDLRSGQHGNRWRVLEEANLIILGSETAGYRINPLDALARAHMVVSEPVREQVIRSQIKGTAVKRKNSMTIKPSDGTRSTTKVNADIGGDKGSRTREQLASDVQDKLNHLFNH